ncbi:T9SS type A sorting domain-containing protein [Dyadobacter psychrotolerans]|uniref:T9SS type A sorting domain-containing protein n=1 Tax=Dyadobacter psychrotolerans TaxID=2541721 RepID=A0A4R5DNM2_9BACT|nr:T9SS type A sorting domain-containing protein [Dyadobacter psychrotolerans]TDE12313.1 T9SS type A sorting domain-containing protein [Dyadobacter psychrotolerans]
MKKHYSRTLSRAGLILSLALLFNFKAAWQASGQSFQIVWKMDESVAGASSSNNFTPDDAELIGANPFSLWPYLSDGNGGSAHVSVYWPTGFTAGRYMDLSYGVSTHEYNLSSISFRVKRSGSGPLDVALRTSMDGFGSNLSTFNLSSDGSFYNVTVPLGFKNLSTGLAFRIYGFNADYRGTFYIDQVVLNGEVTSFVLPVNLTYFNARSTENRVNLFWETSWEKNSKEFIVERSIDLINFSAIGTVNAAGETEERAQYVFQDELPFAGASYYRLKMVDTDLRAAYSKIRDIEIHYDQPILTVSPNPAQPGNIRILKSNIDPAKLILRNILGQNFKFNLQQSEPGYIGLLPDQSLLPGIYVISLLQNGKQVHTKVLVP